MTKDPKSFEQVDQWKTTMFLYSSALKSINTKIEILNNEFIQLYNYNPIEHITSRLKTPSSIVKKLQNDGIDVTIDNMVEYLNDIAGIRIICSFMSDIYPIADMIARQADITVLHVKDYIKYPKSNGYKSYHMVVTIPVYLTDGKMDTKVEIQIRTIAMDFWASLEHKIAYKFEGNPPDYLETELKACADMVDMLDAKMFSLNQAIMEIGRTRREEAEKKLEEGQAAGPAGAGDRGRTEGGTGHGTGKRRKGMKAVLQRVTEASVRVDGEVIGSIGKGFFILLGVSDEDDEAVADKMADKICKLRIFEDENGKTNLSLKDVGGEVLVVSQFTLYADCRKGNRPSFIGAGAPAEADRLYEYFMDRCRTHVDKVEHGRFGADMKVSLVNDGPFTLMLDSRELFK